MAFIVRALGYDTSPVGTMDIYTVPANTSAIISNVRLVNLNTTNSLTANIFVKRSGAANGRLIEGPQTPILAKGLLVMQEEVTLGAGDKLQVTMTGTNLSYSYLVNGVERT